jgi:hypothetical protein
MRTPANFAEQRMRAIPIIPVLYFPMILWGINLIDSKVVNTILDLEGFISFRNSKGFILEQQNVAKEN